MDRSCNFMSNDILKAMESCHKIANSALKTMNMFRNDPGGDRNLEGYAQEEIFEHLFGTLSAKNGRPDPTAKGFDNTMAVFASIARQTQLQRDPPLENGIPSYFRLDPSQVVLYCDYTRFLENFDNKGQPSPGNVIDRSIKVMFPMVPGYEMGKTIKIDRNPVTGREVPRLAGASWAWAWAPWKMMRGLHRPAFIQINSGMSEVFRILGNRGKVLEDVAHLLEHQPAPAATDIIKRSLDFILFHELSHTFLGDPAEIVRDEGGYQWEACVASSKVHGHRNGDNVAFYAFTTHLTYSIPDPQNPDKFRFKPLSFTRAGKAEPIWDSGDAHDESDDDDDDDDDSDVGRAKRALLEGGLIDALTPVR